MPSQPFIIVGILGLLASACHPDVYRPQFKRPADSAFKTSVGAITVLPTSAHNRADSSQALLPQPKTEGFRNVQLYGVKGDGVSDDTAAIQNLLDTNPTGTLFFPSGSYIISDTLRISHGHKIIGESRAGTTFKQQTQDKYAFEFLSGFRVEPYDIDSGMVIESVSIRSLFGIRINQSGLGDSAFLGQAHVKGPIIRNVSLIGGYYSSSDPHYNSSAPVDQQSLNQRGIGISWTKVFNGEIENSQIERFGTGVYFDGCDINKIDNCRLNLNGRHFYSKRTGTYGSQNKLLNCDILHNHRTGGVFLDSVGWHTVKDCYFEAYAPSATYIASQNDMGTSIVDNRFDNTKQTSTPFVSLAPRYSCLFANNRWNPSTPRAIPEIKSTWWSNNNPVLVRWLNNSVEMPKPEFPAVFHGEINPYLIRYDNFVNISGAASLTFPFKLSQVTNRYVFGTDTSTLIFPIKIKDVTHKRFLVKFTGRRLTNSGYHVLRYVEGANTDTLRSGFLGFNKQDEVETIMYTVAVPDGRKATGSFILELVNTQVEYEQVEFYPVDYSLATSIPASGRFAVGDKIQNSAPQVGSPVGWVCVEAGKAHLPSRGQLTSGSRTISGVTNIETWVAGDAIKGSGIPATAIVTAVDKVSAILTISEAATATLANVELYDAVIRPYGIVN